MKQLVKFSSPYQGFPFILKDAEIGSSLYNVFRSAIHPQHSINECVCSTSVLTVCASTYPDGRNSTKLFTPLS